MTNTRLYNERKRLKYQLDKIPDSDKDKVPELIRQIKTFLVNQDLSDTTYEYFGKVFRLVETELMPNPTSQIPTA